MVCIGAIGNTSAGVLVGIGEVAGVVGAHLNAEVVGRVSVLLVADGTVGVASVVGGRAEKTVRAFGDAGVVGEQGKSAIRTELDACPVCTLAIGHIFEQIHLRATVLNTSLSCLVDIDQPPRDTTQQTSASPVVSHIEERTSIHTESDRVHGVAVVEGVHFGRVWTGSDALL